jgi:transposase
MMGIQQSQSELFNYQVNLDKRIRLDHPLRLIAAQIDFTFVREEVSEFYGANGNVSVDPAVLLKMMFLLFFDDVASERELMAVIGERLDYMWFLGYGLDDTIPNHSVLSKARKRWGKETFEKVFIRTVHQCVRGGLVDGTKLHIDSSLIDANASKDSVVKGPPELIAALKGSYAAQESKLEDTSTPESVIGVNDKTMSTTDPDAALARKGGGSSRPRYHHHRVIDDASRVITAVETTPGSIAENKKLLDLIEQHEQHTGTSAQTVVGDNKYGTVENYVACQEQGIRTHLGDVLSSQKNQKSREEIYSEKEFKHRKEDNTYICPVGEVMKPRRLHPTRRTWEYVTRRGVCAKCKLREKCTRSKTGRTIRRHEKQELVEMARAQAYSTGGRRDRRRRQHLIEGSFGQAANEHGFKRSRWRRLWRQQIQDYLIAVVQNVKLLIKHSKKRFSGVLAVVHGTEYPLGMACAARLSDSRRLETDQKNSRYVPRELADIK